MENIEIVRPTTDHYMERVCTMAKTYLTVEKSWYELELTDITDEDDRDEYSFIRMALWDQLMKREFYKDNPPDSLDSLNACGTVEPGILPGSFILGGGVWQQLNTQSSLTAY
jgi:hypothetical protein